MIGSPRYLYISVRSNTIMVVVKYNLSDEIMHKIKQIIESGGFNEEKEVIIRAINNLYEETLDENNTTDKLATEILEPGEVKYDYPLENIKQEVRNTLKKMFESKEFKKFGFKETEIKTSELNQKETFSKRCIVPEMLYGENDFGIIWKFHNRFFCQKWIIHMLAHFMIEKNQIYRYSVSSDKRIMTVHGGTIREFNSWIELREFRDFLEVTTKAFIDKISSNEDLDQLLVGFPSNSTKFLKTPRLRKMKQRKIREAKAKQLEVVSMERFLSQNFRVLAKKENEDTRIAGACFEFGLLEAINRNGQILINFTQEGIDFATMENPALNKIIKSFKKNSLEGKMLTSNLTMNDFDPIFSKDEQKFILEKIIPKFELENKIVKRYLEKNRINVKEMIEIFLEEQKIHMKWGKDVVDEDAVNEYGKGKATTIMRRLVEIGQFKRKKEDGFDKSGKKMQVIVYERL